MDLLYDAAVAWKRLLDFKYDIVCGKSKKLNWISLSFEAGEFYHLAGFPHMKDLTFPVRFSRSKALEKVLDRTITGEDVSKSVNYEWTVKSKLEAIIHLEQLLNRCSKVYIYCRERLPFYTDIVAKYLLVDDAEKVVFLFTDKGENANFFSRSTFVMKNKDFRANQPRMAVLQIKRTDLRTGEESVMFTHPRFTDSNNENA